MALTMGHKGNFETLREASTNALSYEPRNPEST